MRYSNKTGMGHKNLKPQDEYSGLVKLSNIVWPYIVGVLATYGFVELVMQANGF